MVFASTCEHASSAFIFASTSSDQICLASSEHLNKYRWRTARFLFIEKKHFVLSNQADIIQPIPAAYSQFCLVGDDVKLRHIS